LRGVEVFAASVRAPTASAADARTLAAKREEPAMTEAEWLAATDPEQMLPRLWDTISDRKRRLFECACCRGVWDRLPDPRSRLVVEVAERLADGATTEDEERIVADDAYEVWMAERPIAFREASFEEFMNDFYPLPLCAAAWNAIGLMRDWGAVPACDTPHRIILEISEQRAVDATLQASLLRCIFGNPFRPVAFDPRWRTETAVALASAIYDGRHFDRLPILADALEDAGCDSLDLLNHLRGPGPHSRGCWAVDAVLGRS
jgi:hypothetical protein